jgi:TrkA domain protein
MRGDGIMKRIEEIPLPGVGVRHEFETTAGERLGMVTHRGGRRELLLFEKGDPDACARTIPLEEDDARALSEILGAAPVTRSVREVRQSLGALSIDWIPITAGWPCTGERLMDTQIRERAGVLVVGIVRGDETIATPPPETVLAEGDTLVVVGSDAAIARASAMLSER